jgi:tRNA modification GTPase
VLREHLHIDGMPLHVIDTAGLRESGDEIETEGMRRARAQMERADRVLWVIDDTQPDASLSQVQAHFPGDVPITRVHNKIDLSKRAPKLLAEELRQSQQVLGEITGEFSSDDLLGTIFTSFCIGK